MKNKNHYNTIKSPSVEGDLGGVLKVWQIKVNHRLPYNPKLKQRARDLRKNPTHTEKLIWEKYFSKLPNIRILRQRPIDNYIVDFYISSKKLIIEIDWDIHKQRKEYDFQRDKILEWYWLKIIRISNDEILNDFENLCVKLNRFLW